VYRFRDGRGRTLYIGRATDLRRRTASYWTGLGDRRHLIPMVGRIRRVEAIVCDSVHEAAWLERNLLERDLPDGNRTAGGQEVPVYICLYLPAGRRGPQLTVSHQPPVSDHVRCFGPYLGGSKLRLAVSGLHRLFPLDPASEASARSARELARARRLDAVDPADVTTRITAALNRDPQAIHTVHEALRLRRDEASAQLAFEVAARAQAESDALMWIFDEQKVTTREPVDVDVHGWASDVLLRFEIRGGRLCRWVQQPSSRAAADVELATTPATWRPFAQRNAVLAAALLRHPC
jgi:excinuclease ABC subunit C